MKAIIGESIKPSLIKQTRQDNIDCCKTYHRTVKANIEANVQDVSEIIGSGNNIVNSQNAKNKITAEINAKQIIQNRLDSLNNKTKIHEPSLDHQSTLTKRHT